MASGCDQCVWAVGVVAGHGHWIGHWCGTFCMNVVIQESA